MCATRPELNPCLPEEKKPCVQILCMTPYGMSVKCESGHLRCAALTLAAARNVLRENNRFKTDLAIPLCPPSCPSLQGIHMSIQLMVVVNLSCSVLNNTYVIIYFNK